MMDEQYRLVAQQDDPGRKIGLDLLSAREMEISLLVSAGRTNQQIAHTLRLSHKTVETYLARIFRKLAVRSRTEVATLIGRRQRTDADLRLTAQRSTADHGATGHWLRDEQAAAHPIR